jgi:hypothetical protein
VTASLRRTVTVTVAALGVAFLLVWAATTGPERVVGERHTTSETTQTQQRPASEPDQATQQPGSRDEQPTRGSSLSTWVQDLGTFAVLVAGLLVLGRVLHQLFVHLRRGLPGEQLVLTLEPLPDLDAAREAVKRSQQRQREALGWSDVRNGIVECWVIFEEAAAEANVAKSPAETATEFVVRLLHILDVDPRPVGRLAQLFHEARFSTHPMAADARARAEAALAAIHRDLARAGAAT